MPFGMEWSEVVHIVTFLPLCSFGVLYDLGFLVSKHDNHHNIYTRPESPSILSSLSEHIPDAMDSGIIDPSSISVSSVSAPLILDVSPQTNAFLAKFGLEQFSTGPSSALAICVGLVLFLLAVGSIGFELIAAKRLDTQIARNNRELVARGLSSPDQPQSIESHMQALWEEIARARRELESASQQALAEPENPVSQGHGTQTTSQPQESPRIAALEEKIAAQQTLIDIHEAETNVAATALRDVEEKSSTIAALREQISSQEEHIETLKAEIDMVAGQPPLESEGSSRLASLEGQVTSQHELIEQQKVKLQQQRADLEEKDKANDLNRQIIESLKEKVNSSETKREQEEDELETLQDELAKMKSQFTAMESRLAQKDAMLQSWDDRFVAAMNETNRRAEEQYKSKLQEKNKAHADLEKAYKLMEDAFSEHVEECDPEGKVETLEKENKQLEQKHEAKLQELQNEHQQEKERLQEASDAKLAQSKSRIVELERQAMVAQQQQDRLKDDLAAQKTKIAMLEREAAEGLEVERQSDTARQEEMTKMTKERQQEKEKASKEHQRWADEITKLKREVVGFQEETASMKTSYETEKIAMEQAHQRQRDDMENSHSEEKEQMEIKHSKDLEKARKIRGEKASAKAELRKELLRQNDIEFRTYIEDMKMSRSATFGSPSSSVTPGGGRLPGDDQEDRADEPGTSTAPELAGHDRKGKAPLLSSAPAQPENPLSSPVASSVFNAAEESSDDADIPESPGLGNSQGQDGKKKRRRRRRPNKSAVEKPENPARRPEGAAAVEAGPASVDAPKPPA